MSRRKKKVEPEAAGIPFDQRTMRRVLFDAQSSLRRLAYLADKYKDKVPTTCLFGDMSERLMLLGQGLDSCRAPIKGSGLPPEVTGFDN